MRGTGRGVERTAGIHRRPGAGPDHRRMAGRTLSRRAGRRPGAAASRIWCPSRCSRASPRAWACRPRSRWRRARARAGVRKRATVLADATEALIGALYLDGGLAPARDFVRRAWAQAMDGAWPSRPRTRRRRCRNGLQARGAGTARLRGGLARGTAARPGVRDRRQRRRRAAARAGRAASAPPSGSPPPTCSADSARHDQPLRLRGHRRRARTPANRRCSTGITGAKLSIVSPKAQTTRFRVLGIFDARRDARCCWSTRPASSSRAAGWTGRWSPPPGPARRMPTSCCSWWTRRPG